MLKSVILLLILFLSKSNGDKTGGCFHQEYNHCSSDSCKSYAARLASTQNESVNPCENPFQRFCGTFANQQPHSDEKKNNTIVYLHNYFLRDRKRWLLEADYENHLKSYPANLYKSCKNLNRRQELGYKPLLDFVDEIGGFPLLDKDWKESNFDFEMAYITLRSKHNLNSIIELNFRPHLDNLYQLELQMSPIDDDLRVYLSDKLNDTTATNKRKTYIKELLNLISSGQMKAEDFETEIDSLVLFETQLAQLSSDYRNERNQTFNITELDSTFPGIKWTRIITEIFRGIPVFRKGFDGYFGYKYPSQQQIRISDSNFYYENLGNLLKNTSSRIIADYMALNLVEHYAKYATIELQDLYENKHHQKSDDDNWEKCLALVSDKLFYIFERIFIDKYFPISDEIVIRRMFDVILQSFEGYVESNSWMDEESKRTALNKLSKSTIKLGSTKWIRNDELLKNYYSEVENVTADNFLVNLAIINAATFKRDLRRLHGISFEDQPGDVNDGGYFYYDQNKNQLSINSFFLEYPINPFEAPISVKFGTLGFFAVTGLSKFIQGDNSKPKLWWTLSTVENEIKDVNATILRMFSLKESIDISFDAFKMFELKFKNTTELLPQEVVKYNGDQSFFASFAHSFCANGELAKVIENDVNNALNKSHNFLSAFKCCSNNS